MDEKLKKFAQRLTGIWKAFDKKKKIIIISSAAAVVVIIIMVVTALNTTQYELLCSGLSVSEAGEVYNAVSGKNIPVKVSGTSIYVQKGTADTMRMQLAEQGLPQGSLPYKLYDSGGNFAETEKDKNLKWLRQTQDRLQSTIETIPGVTQAIVNIAQSSADTYVLESDKTPTTASVKLTLKSGTVLSKSQVNGIAAVVANGVTGLKTENVTIADSNGTVLNGESTNTDITAEQLLAKNRVESDARAKLQRMLSQIYGDNNYNVVVNADINFDSKNTETISYSSGVPTYVSEGGKVQTNGSSGANGQAGVSGAQPTYPNASGTNGTEYTSSYSKVTSMAVNSYKEIAKQNGGKLNRMTVAIILNTANAAAASTDVAGLKQNIAAAVGATVDDVSISQMAFSSLAPSSSSMGSFKFPFESMGSNLLYIIVAAGLLLIVLITLMLVLLKQRKKKRAVKQQKALLEAAQAALPKNPDGTAAEPKPPAMPIKSIEETLAEAQVNSLKKEIEDFTDKKPDLVAQILKNWLKD